MVRCGWEAIIPRMIQPQLNLCAARLDHLMFITVAWAYCSLSLRVKAFLLCSFGVWTWYIWGTGVSVIVVSCLTNSSWLPTCTQTGTEVETLWPRCGRPTETGLPLILRMKRGDNALYMFPFLELLIIVRSATWPKNRFLMRCCFPVSSTSTCFWVHWLLQPCRHKPQFSAPLTVVKCGPFIHNQHAYLSHYHGVLTIYSKLLLIS